MPETALVLLIPEAEPLVGQVRAEHDPSAREGVPAHITVIIPFLEMAQIDAVVRARLERVIGETAPMELTFARVDHFPAVRWLAPEPAAPIVALTEALATAFPDCKPYGGMHAEIIPHLTFAVGEDSEIDKAADTVTAGLTKPVRSRVSQCTLFEHTNRGWCERMRLDFGKIRSG